MNSLFLYVLSVLIWGTTWYTIKFQLGVVAPEISVAYRFALASLILFVWARWKGVSLKLGRAELAPVVGLGVCMFGLNYLLTYLATEHLTSGVVALSFSVLTVFNIFNLALFFGQKFSRGVLLGSLLGLLGVVFVFESELEGFGLKEKAWYGLVLALLATYVASIGNIIAQKMGQKGTSVVRSNAYAMAFGAFLIFVIGLSRGEVLSFDPRPSYWISLVYLSVFGSVIAFGAYRELIRLVGADRSAYAAVMIPIVALGVSTVFEGFQWSFMSVLGLLLALAGNFIVLKAKRSL